MLKTHLSVSRPALRSVVRSGVLVALCLTSLRTHADQKAPVKVAASNAGGTAKIEPVEFDRLDGKGPSRKRVDVIEWESNLEIHVYPRGSLSSLGLKVDRTNKNSPIMVIEYGLTGIPYTLVRRAALSIKINDSFQTFIDPTEGEYDKILISNNSLDGVKPFKSVHAPRQLYPDHYGDPEGAPAPLGETDPDTASPVSAAAASPAKTYEGVTPSRRSEPGVRMKEKERVPANVDSEGNIREFNF